MYFLVRSSVAQVKVTEEGAFSESWNGGPLQRGPEEANKASVTTPVRIDLYFPQMEKIWCN